MPACQRGLLLLGICALRRPLVPLACAQEKLPLSLRLENMRRLPLLEDSTVCTETIDATQEEISV